MSQAASSISAMPATMRSPRVFNPWLVAVVVSIATFMEVLDTSIANVSLRHIAGSLAAGQQESTWVLTSYLVANAAILPISGWLATAVGRKRFYMLCVAGFTISSLLCGLSQSLPQIILFRVLQGLSGGGLAPCEQAILADLFPPEKRGMAFALYGVAVVAAPALGPTLGGWITDNYSWHWIFLINVPVGILSLVLSGIMLQDSDATKRARANIHRGGLRIDFVGAALAMGGLACLEVFLDTGEQHEWFASPMVLSFAVAAVLLILGMIVWELYQERPVVDLGLFANRNFASSSILMFMLGFILFGSTQLLPQLLQSVHGYNAYRSGLTLTAGGVALLFVMPFVGKLLKIIQPKRMVMIGLAIEFLALGHMSFFSADLSFGHAAAARVFQALGLAFLFIPINTQSYVGLAPEKSNSAAAMLNLCRNLGGSVGIALSNTYLAHRMQIHHGHLAEHVTPLNPNFVDRAQHIAQLLGGGVTENAQLVVGVIYQQLQRQAAMLSYNDIFRLFSILALVSIPLTLLMSKPKKGEPIHAGH